MKKFYMTFLLLLVCIQALALLKDNKNKEPIHIFSDEKMIFDQNKLKISAYENAVLTQGVDSLKADELHGYFKEVEAKTEDGEKYELERIEAIGNVKVISPDKIATGEYGNYYLDKEQIILERNVVISDGANEVKGGYGIMNRNEGTTQVYSSKPGTKQTKKKRVTAFLAKTKKDSKK